MIKGFYAAASAMVANLNRQTLISHNISNMNTPGFKQYLMTMEDYEQTNVVPSTSVNYTNPFTPSVFENVTLQQLKWVGDLGLGTQSSEDEIDLSQGALETTGEDLDLAIDGAGFFHVRTPDGDRYTRDGRFMRDASGGMVTSEGYRVLDENGSPITLPNGETEITTTGAVLVNKTQVAKMSLAVFTNPTTDLQRDGANLFQAVGTPTTTGQGKIQQKSLEMSNVDVTQMTTQMITVSRSYQAAANLVTIQDNLLSQSISTLGRL